MPHAEKTCKPALMAVAVGIVGAAVAVLVTPPDQKLGAMVRFVMFHGASTWVNMATFTIAGLLGIAMLAGATSLRRWEAAFRWVSLPLWAVNTVLGVLSMKLIWGGILWGEPRLAMTFGVLAGAALVFAGEMLLDSPRISAVLDALLAATLWVMVLVLPNLFHPDSPVFSSGNPAYIAAFLGMVASIAVTVFGIVVLVAKRPRPRAEQDARVR
ncbi:MAG: hypothetical protein ABFC80_02085 [Coriobacteriales bacterium]